MGKIQSHKSNKRKSNTKKNRPRKESFRLWMDSHKFLGFFLVLGLILAIGLGLNLIFENLPIPLPYRDINYSFPLYLNIVLLVNASYHSFLRTFRKEWISLQNFAEMFLYLNGIACVLQLTIGMTSKRGRRLLPIWALDYRYIWFPLVTYFIFFLVPIVTIIISKYIEKKKRKKENGEDSLE